MLKLELVVGMTLLLMPLCLQDMEIEGYLLNRFLLGCGFVVEFCQLEVVAIFSLSSEKMPDLHA
jgi:hypothetical protein